MNRMSPAAIKELGNIILKAAMEQAAKDAGVAMEELPALMLSDASVAKRVKDYTVSGFNFATGKV
jgi:hypothetical protein